MSSQITLPSSSANGRRARWAGWIAVGISTCLACLWAFWGIIENFHEGWYDVSLARNLGMLFLQYLVPLAAFMGVGAAAIRWPRVGGVLHAAAGVFAIWFFRRGAGVQFVGVPLIGLGLLYWFGRPAPRRLALLLVLLLPTLVLLAAGAEPAWRVAGRVDDGDRGPRLVEGNGVRLLWAPVGPGWPQAGGLSWEEAKTRCAHLTQDGTALDSTALGDWQLPTVEQAVRSMARHGRNAGGEWDAVRRHARYATRPDKESPLWDPHSPVIYWWTATEATPTQAFIITYAGGVFVRSKQRQPLYHAYRCVRQP